MRRATGLGAGRSSGRGEKRYAPPSIFSSKKKRGEDKKPTVYVRDIVLLPFELRQSLEKSPTLEVPVGSRRVNRQDSVLLGYELGRGSCRNLQGI